MIRMDPHIGAGDATAAGSPADTEAPVTDDALLASAQRALRIEARALEQLAPRLGPGFAHACRICLA